MLGTSQGLLCCYLVALCKDHSSVPIRMCRHAELTGSMHDSMLNWGASCCVCASCVLLPPQHMYACSQQMSCYCVCVLCCFCCNLRREKALLFLWDHERLDHLTTRSTTTLNNDLLAYNCLQSEGAAVHVGPGALYSSQPLTLWVYRRNNRDMCA
jgi:hypothetical protein